VTIAWALATPVEPELAAAAVGLTAAVPLELELELELELAELQAASRAAAVSAAAGASRLLYLCVIALFLRRASRHLRDLLVSTPRVDDVEEALAFAIRVLPAGGTIARPRITRGHSTCDYLE
jgi:hypothetical protein